MPLFVTLPLVSSRGICSRFLGGIISHYHRSFIAACNLEPGHRFLCGHQFLRKLLRNFLCQKQTFPGKGVSCLKSAPGSRVLKILQIYIYVQRAVAVTLTLNDLHFYLSISIYLLTCGSVLSGHRITTPPAQVCPVHGGDWRVSAGGYGPARDGGAARLPGQGGGGLHGDQLRHRPHRALPLQQGPRQDPQDRRRSVPGMLGI